MLAWGRHTGAAAPVSWLRPRGIQRCFGRCVTASLLSVRPALRRRLGSEQRKAGALGGTPAASKALRGLRRHVQANSGMPCPHTSTGSPAETWGCRSALCGSSGTTHRGRSNRLTSSEASGSSLRSPGFGPPTGRVRHSGTSAGSSRRTPWTPDCTDVRSLRMPTSGRNARGGVITDADRFAGQLRLTSAPVAFGRWMVSPRGITSRRAPASLGAFHPRVDGLPSGRPRGSLVSRGAMERGLASRQLSSRGLHVRVSAHAR